MKLSGRAKRMIVHQERNRAGAQINLIPMIDILSVLVSFLLIYSTEVELVQNTKGIDVPESVSEARPRETVVVMITPSEVLVQGEPVARVADIVADDSIIIRSLKAALTDPNVVMPDSAARPPAEREITIMGDKVVPYEVLKRVMATCTDADYGRVSLALLQKEKPAPAAQARLGV